MALNVGQRGSAELLFVGLGVGAGGEEQRRSPPAGRAGGDELVDALGDVTGFATAPMLAGVGIARLVGDEQLDGMAEHRVREVARGRERLVFVAERGLEEVVDRGEHLGPGAVVAPEHERLRASSRRERKTSTSA